MRALALVVVLVSGVAFAEPPVPESPPAMVRVDGGWMLTDEGEARIQSYLDEQAREIARVTVERDTLAELSTKPRLSPEAVVALLVVGALLGGGAVYLATK